jgi:hypothetical protein
MSMTNSVGPPVLVYNLTHEKNTGEMASRIELDKRLPFPIFYFTTDLTFEEYRKQCSGELSQFRPPGRPSGSSVYEQLRESSMTSFHNG